MPPKKRVARSRIVLLITLGIFLLIACGLLVFEISGHSPATLLRNYELKAEIRSISRLSDAEVKSSANLLARQVGGRALAQTIRQSRAQALLEKTFPVPKDIRDELEPHFPTIDFDALRWKPANGRLSLGTALTQWYLRDGAIVLKDLIIFNALSTAQDLPLWAHELTHVVQYQELGIDRFARTYVLDHAKLEEQARQNAWAVMAEVKNRSSSQPQ